MVVSIPIPESLQAISEQLTAYLRSKDPLLLVASAFVAGYTVNHLWQLHRDDRGLRRRIRERLFYLIRLIPQVRRQIEEGIDEARVGLVHSIHGTDKSGHFHQNFPADGLAVEKLINEIQEYANMECANYMDGRCSGAIFNTESDSDEMKVYAEVCKHFAWSNPLWPKLFPGVRKMEAEVVRMCCDLLHGGPESCGTMSTGGTASILLACLAHRNRALERGIQFPEMVLPESAHAAFTKAGELFRLKIVKIPVDKKTYRVDVRKMRKAINNRTCMLVGSTPSFPTGSHDDIEAIGQLGLDYGVPVHVDACLGGFLLPFIEEARPFDFSVPGVCSISADTHKYGLAPKGSSVVLYRSKDYLHNQYFCDPDWQGGIYASATLDGSRAGLNIALCWASLRYYGTDGYRKSARAVVEATRKLRDGIAEIDGLRLMGDADTCIVAWTGGEDVSINRFHALMDERKWSLTCLQFPSGVHLMVTLLHTQDGVIEKLLDDARQVVDEIRRTPNAPLTGTAALYGMAQKLPDRSVVHDFASAYLDACYAPPPPK